MGTIKLNKNENDTTTSLATVKEQSADTKTIEKIPEQAYENLATQTKKVNKLAELDEGFVEELENLRTENTTVYRRNDRTFRKIISSVPVRYRDKNGELKEIKNTLTDTGEEITNSENSFKVKFSKDSHSGKIFDLQKGATKLTLSAVGNGKARGHACGCKCELCSDSDNTVSVILDDGTEIQYVTLNDRIKENILIKDKRDSYEYDFTLDIGDLTVEEGEHNDLLLKNKSTGGTEFMIPAPFMYDADGKYSNAVSYEIDVSGQTLIIKVIASAEFINADETKLPITIDPQIVADVDGLMRFETTEDQDDASYYHENVLKAYCSLSSSERDFAKISIKKSLMPSYAESVLIQLTAKDNVYGKFYINNTFYDAVAGKTYTIDITENINKYKDSIYIDIDIYIDVIYGEHYVEFYTTGEYMPTILLVSKDDPDMENKPTTYDNPNLKEFEFCDNVTGYLDLNDGIMTTAVKAFNGEDLAVPLDVVHYYRAGNGDNGYGNNWRLNLNKKLIIANDDTQGTTSYTYVDEAGYNYNFIEKYYYLENGIETFVLKNKVNIDESGNLAFEGKPVYKHQSCNGYTLVPELNDFINVDLIEQRQNEQIQLEQTVESYENSLIDYVAINAEGEIKVELSNLDKQTVNKFFTLANKVGACIMPKSDALQARSVNLAGLSTSDTNNYGDQFDFIVEKSEKTLPQVKKAFETYYRKKAELEKLWRILPVRFLRDKDGIISGFNKYGDLAYISNSYGNYVSIERDIENKIIGLYDSNNKAVYFEYAEGILQSITDSRSRTVKFSYEEGKLRSVDCADGSSLLFEYSSKEIRSIKTSEDFQYKFSLDDSGKVKTITTNTRPVTISKSVTRQSDDFNKTLAQVSIEYDTNSTVLTDKCKNKETYTFNADKKITSYKEEKNTGVITLTEYEEYLVSHGKRVISTKSTNLDDKVVKTTEKYNDRDLLNSTQTEWQQVSETAQLITWTAYEYDNEERIIKEETTKVIACDDGNHSMINVKEYHYNSYGSLVLTESYVKGEELTSGKNFEERVYDANGRLTKTITWNSLDSSTKFYSEKVYAENGQVAADKNETGEIAAEYEYSDGANVVNTIKYPNGGKLAYGRNPYNDVVTAVTQSTEDGEANSTEIFHEHGLPVEVKSNNTVIAYTYDHNRRKTKVEVNGTELYNFSYKDYSYNTNQNKCTFGEQTTTLKNGNTNITFVSSKTGVLDEATGRILVTESTKINDAEQFRKTYNADGKLVNTLDCTASVTTAFTYDAYNNITKIASKNITEDYAYNAYGELVSKSVSGATEQTYSYIYKDNAARDLDYIAFGSYKFKSLKDLNGRNTGKEVFNGQNKVAGEYISYKKVGDHATNLPSTLWFASGADIKDNIRYKYDRGGNICEITENGHIVAKYKYDSLNRLIREDDKALNKTTVYSYDTNGNITRRCEYQYTTKAGEELSELACTHFEYGYDGDKLLSFNGEKCEYDLLGNPTTYRGKNLNWQYGKRLVNFYGTPFSYDGLGRRASKGTTTFTYDNAGHLIAQSNGLQFVYDNSGVIGFIHNETQYFYRKDIQGNIVAILDELGAVVVKYIYDAWGNHAVLDADGADIEDSTHIGNLNPFRYRGYYYDVETGLYFLQTRYYDPETGRFISQDSIEYADPETINGLNLYAYCGNNPVMNVDPTGEFLLALLLISAGVIVGGVASGIMAGANAAEGESFGAAFLGGFINGIFSGVGLALGLAVAASGGVGLFIVGGVITVVSGFIGGSLGNAASQQISYGDVDWNVAAIAGGISAAINLATFLGMYVSGVFSIARGFCSKFIKNLYINIIPLSFSVFWGTLPFFNPNDLRGKIKN